MDNTARSAHSGLAGPAVPLAAPEGASVFRIRWGRTVLALVGTMAAAAFVTGTLLALFGALPAGVPLVALLVVAIVVATLRGLAVRDRRLRARARAERALAEPVEPEAEPERPARPRETVLFNADAAAGGESAAERPAALSAEQLRAEALKVAAEADRRAAVSGPGTGSAWQPVELPKPTYVDAAKAERPAPEPLPAPEVKKPTAKTYLKQDPALKPAAAAAETPAAQAAPARPQTAKLNLDAVLQRRRA
ncbi:hypothetical protein [Arthrobacter mobilis]|uniref:Uncharacterized protein n=1 Tax=Arthrobacter mobilis TaxID=2724944 RepID=A0A7X6K2Y8_9MICC|nr:hypothetical protein [Arthrobacter mobilis]NKX53707.1 hypothetical protein [Arthrobacter mobilis]